MKKNHFQGCRFVLSTIASFPAILFVYSPFLLGVTLIGVAIPFATGRLIDALAYGRPFQTPFLVLSALLLVKALLTPLLERYICARSRRIETDLQFRVLDTIMNFSPGRLAALPDGEVIAKLTRDTYAIGGFVRGLYPRALQAVTMMLAAGFALQSRSSLLGIGFIVFFPLVLLLFVPFAQRFAANSHRVRAQGDASFNSLIDFLTTLPLLRTLDAEQRFADAPQNALEKLKDGNSESDALTIRFGFLLGFLLVAGQIAVLGIAGSLAAKGAIPVGDVVLYQMLFLAALQSIQGVIALLPELAALREAADSLGEVFRYPPPKPVQDPLAPLETLAFDHVTFAYPRTPDHPVVRDFSATFRPGSIVGLFGANGAGKSTLLKLAVGAMEPQSGAVRFNGIPLDRINRPLFRQRIGVVFQDSLLVTGTIRENITLRDPKFTPDDLQRALERSGFDDVVKRLPQGLDTIVGNFFRTLSGGERQRLAIARAIIRNPQILIFDEATNHLDANARKSIAGLIQKLRPGRLILLAGHDAELDKLCDVKISCQIPENDSYIMV